MTVAYTYMISYSDNNYPFFGVRSYSMDQARENMNYHISHRSELSIMNFAESISLIQEYPEQKIIDRVVF